LLVKKPIFLGDKRMTDLRMIDLVIWQYLTTYPINKHINITAVTDDPVTMDTEMIAASDPRSEA
jgi:hypothetical protein